MSRVESILEIINIGADIAEKYLENIMSFNQPAKYVFRKFTSKAL